MTYKGGITKQVTCPICGGKKDYRAKKCLICFEKLEDHTKHLGNWAKLGAIPWNKGLHGVQAGENSPRWKGGLTDIKSLIRNSVRYQEWRNSVFERDEYTCRNCHNKNILLNAHHIVPFKLLVKRNNLVTLEDAYYCAELWDLENGLTLCLDCHNLTKKVERKVYG